MTLQLSFRQLLSIMLLLVFTMLKPVYSSARLRSILLCRTSPFNFSQGSPYAVCVHKYLVIDRFYVGYFEPPVKDSLGAHLCRRNGFHELQLSHSTSCLVARTLGSIPLDCE